MQDDGEAGGTQVGATGTDISSTPSGDVDMLEGPEQEPVVFVQWHNNATEKVTVEKND
jgi:hypothetical protein